MAQADGNPGVNRLAKALNSQIKKYHKDLDSNLTIDFGEIAKDWSLHTEGFDLPIPKGEYQVSRLLTGISLGGDVKSPELKKGDKVIVAWINQEVVVLDVYVPSSKL